MSYEAGSISGYKFVTGILQMAVNKGLKLYTETTATSLKYEDGLWIVETTRGVICAQRVVLASNGYTAALYHAFQGKIVPLKGQMTAQRRGDKMPPADPPRGELSPAGFVRTGASAYSQQASKAGRIREPWRPASIST